MAGIDDIKNAAEKAAGKVKEAVGNATDNDRLKAEGQTDQGKKRNGGFLLPSFRQMGCVRMIGKGCSSVGIALTRY
jgi:hypothetical protein